MATWQKGQLWCMRTPPTDGTPMTLLAAAAMKFDGTINDAINETTKLTSGDKSIVASIGPFDEGPEFDRGEGDIQGPYLFCGWNILLHVVNNVTHFFCWVPLFY